MEKFLKTIAKAILRFFDKIIVEEMKRVDQFCNQYL